MMISFTDSILGSFFFLISLLAYARACVCYHSRHGLHWHRAAGGRSVPDPCWRWWAELSRPRAEAGQRSIRWDSERNTTTLDTVPWALRFFFLYIRGLAPVFSILARVSHLLQWRRLFMTLSSCSACELCVWRETLWVWKQPRPSPKLWRAKTCSRYCSGCCYLFVYFL